MFSIRSLAFSSFVFGFALVISAEAFGQGVVYDNLAGGPSGVDLFLRSDNDEPFITTDDVTLPTTTRITQVNWSGIYFEFTAGSIPQTDAFTILFFADDVGLPDTGGPIAEFSVGDNVNRVDSGFTGAVSRDIYEYSANIDFTLNAGTTYWLSIANDTPSSSLDFFGGVLNGQGNAFHSTDGGNSWTSRTHRLDFQLISIPEPNMFALEAVCLLALMLRRARPTPRCG